MQGSLTELVLTDYDVSGFDIAPVGSQIDIGKQGFNVSLPDISGLSLVD